MSKLTRHCLGSVGVDSGQLLVMDPCYIRDQVDDREAFYDMCCGASVGSGSVLPYKAGHLGLAAVFPSGYGDGVYPVYAHVNSDGRVVRVTVEMGD